MTAAATDATPTVTMPAAPMTAAAMIREQACSAPCLVAAAGETAACNCPCRGAFHGSLGNTLVPGSAGRKPPPAPTPDEPALFDVEVRTAS